MNQDILFYEIECRDGIYFSSVFFRDEWIVKNQELYSLNSDLFWEVSNFELNRRGNFIQKKWKDVESHVQEVLEEEKSLGVKLFNTFFPENTVLRSKLEDITEQIRNHEIDSIKVIFCSKIPKVLNLPLMMLHHPNEPSQLIKNYDRLIIAFSPISSKEFKLNQKMGFPPLRILYITALPHDLKPNEQFLNFEKEQLKVLSALDELVSEGQISIEFISNGSLEGIRKALKRSDPHVIHISAHGRHSNIAEEGILILENNTGGFEKVSGVELAEVFSNSNNLRLVLLAACESAFAEEYGLAGALLNSCVPNVIGMRFPISDPVAIEFARSFYFELSKKKTISQAIKYAQVSLIEREASRLIDWPENFNYSEWFSPIFFTRELKHELLDWDFELAISNQTTLSSEEILGDVLRRKDIYNFNKLFQSKKFVGVLGLPGIGKLTFVKQWLVSSSIEESHEVIWKRGVLDILKLLESLLTSHGKKKLSNLLKSNKDISNKQTFSEVLSILRDFVTSLPFVLIFSDFQENLIDRHQTDSTKIEFRKTYLLWFFQDLKSILSKKQFVIIISTLNIEDFFVSQYYLNEFSYVEFRKVLESKYINLGSLSARNQKYLWDYVGGYPRILEIINEQIPFGSPNSKQFKEIVHSSARLVIDNKLSRGNLFLKERVDALSQNSLKLLTILTAFSKPIPISRLYLFFDKYH